MGESIHKVLGSLSLSLILFTDFHLAHNTIHLVLYRQEKTPMHVSLTFPYLSHEKNVANIHPYLFNEHGAKIK